MTDIIETNFTHIKEILLQNKQDIINAITTEKNKDISKLECEIKDLKNELKEKHNLIIELLSSNEGELKSKDKGKDELIASLNSKNELLNQ